MSINTKKIAVIGAGISGLSAAAYLAKAGNEVYVYEKHPQPGGRARQFETANGFTFDMGPSWYWMPDIMDDFFADFGYRTQDFYELVSLDPQFEMIFSDMPLSMPASFEEMKQIFEDLEKGAGQKLEEFMQSAEFKYEVGMKEFVQKPCHHWMEFASPKIALSALKLDLLTNFRSYVKKYFKHPKLRTIMEFPVIFLGASPQNIPALYSLMNFGGYKKGTYYPMGGFYQLILAMQEVAEKQGAKFHFHQNVEKIVTDQGLTTGLRINGRFEEFDAVVASSDYHHSETLLDEKDRNYSEAYWEQRTFAPSCLIYYLGFNQKIKNLKHHSLFFEFELDDHIDSIYQTKQWPDQPLFYACCPSKTDPQVAPENGENLFLLIPLANDLEDKEATREKYLQMMLDRLETKTGEKNLNEKIIYKRSYCVSDFIQDYNAYGGNAYGLANILSQTAVRKPKIRNKQISNLFYTGQLTVPGPGVPPSIISGKIVAQEVNKLKMPAL